MEEVRSRCAACCVALLCLGSGALQSSWLLTGLFCGFEIHAGGVGLHADSISMSVR